MPQRDALDRVYQRAESLLVAGQLPVARQLAEQLQRSRPRDPHALTLLARVHLAWPVIGRYKAESLLVRAAALDSLDPEPSYYLGHVGLALGGDDGEMISRPALLRVLALNPDYRDAWALWLRLYRGDGARRDAVRVLELHQGSSTADLRRGQLLVELRDHAEAERVLALAVAARPRDPAPRALLARTLFEAGRDAEGALAYEGALRLAHLDTAEALWLQVRSVASPRERERYATTPPDHREAFLRRFWAPRDPNLRTPANERLGEHFRRYAEAQRGFALLHPNARYHRSSTWRALAGGVGGLAAPDFGPIIASALASPCIAEVRSVRHEGVAAGGGPRVPDGGGQPTPNLEDLLDDRGRIWVRYGRPDHRYVYGLDGETWCYNTTEGMLRVTFVRRTGGWGASGDLVVTPVMVGEAESAAHLLATDRPTIESNGLWFSFWPAAFRREVGSRTELVLFPDSVSATAVLVNDDGLEVARDTGTNRPLRLVAPPGQYLVLLDGERSGRVGRYRSTMPLPVFAGGELSVSSMLVAAGAVEPTRAAMERAAPAALRLYTSVPMRLYAEVYGLRARGGAVTYQATYRFERTDRELLGLRRRERLITIDFHRALPAAESHVETLVIDPGRLPRGHYRVSLEISDPARGTRVSSASLQFDLR